MSEGEGEGDGARVKARRWVRPLHRRVRRGGGSIGGGVSRGTRRRGGEAMKLPALPNGDDGRFVEYVELL